jgi:putative ABC transport system permease protein
VLTETIVLALAGGAAGSLLAYWLVALIRTAPNAVLPGVQDVHVDVPALAFAAVISVVAGLAVGAVAAIRSLRPTRLPQLTGRASPIAAGGRITPSRTLVSLQIAAATILIAIAGLLVESFVRARAVPTGFDTSHVLSFRLTLPARTYVDAVSRQRVFADLADAIRAEPGVTAVSGTNGTLDGVAVTWGTMTIDGRPQPGEPEVFNRRVGPDFFRLLQMKLRGREFSDADIGTAARVAIVNEAFARKFFNGSDPLGHHLTFSGWNVDIVGVTADARDATTSFSTAVEPALYLPPDATYELAPMVMLVRSNTDPAATVPGIRAAVARIDPDLAMYDTLPLDDLIALRTASPQLYSLISSVTAAVALTLAAIGLVGLLNFVVGARTRELGVRMALGANHRRVVGIVVRDAATMIVAGAIIGIAGALMTTTLLAGLLFEVRPGDPARLVLAVTVLFGVGLVAAFVPARRATRIDPVAALRAE